MTGSADMATAETMLPAAAGDCWNRIGVRGDGSCPALAEHVHCRNCPVYAAAALDLLDRPPPPGYLAEWSDHFRQADLEADRDDGASLSILIFRVGAEWMALPTMIFQEVAELRPVHSLPRRRSGTLLGIVNVRGEILACLSLARLLDIATVESGSAARAGLVHQRLLVVGRGGRRIALPVDEVYGVHRCRPSALDPVPATLAAGQAPFVRGVLGWKERAVGCLDADRLLDAIDRSLA